ncbi:hypothetical protein TrLO_g12660 [Triparma laevis f. longispina]|uniref:HTH myb-type domain-containing protein n=1 Tax=Triparma laevis f. longispina TaxID=1714387 RepID=A0A9W7FB23_9STRA|nr:hypothetical protein TrLO_g12660 [Triparma laevis f. longispina]
MSPPPPPPSSPYHLVRSGRWSINEQLVFLQGLRKYGKGQWKCIGREIPTRSLIQIKSHAQKVLKKIDAGENVFKMLDSVKEMDFKEEMLKENYVVKKSRKPAKKKAPSSIRGTKRLSSWDGSENGERSSSEDEDAAQALSFLHQSPMDGPDVAPIGEMPCLNLDDDHGLEVAQQQLPQHPTSASHPIPLPPPYRPNHAASIPGYPPSYPTTTPSSYPTPTPHSVPISSSSSSTSSSVCSIPSLSTSPLYAPIKQVVKASPPQTEDAEILLSLLAVRSGPTEGKKRMRSPLFEENGQNTRASPVEMRGAEAPAKLVAPNVIPATQEGGGERSRTVSCL